MILFAADDLRRPLLEKFLSGQCGSALRDRMCQFTFPALFSLRSLPPGAWVFSALESLTPAELLLVEHIQNALSAAGCPVLNRATQVLRRCELLSRLHESGQNAFRVYPAEGRLEGIRYPVFVREADEHHGSLTTLLQSRAALDRAMLYLRLRGFARHQLLVVEFCETVSPDGQYRKYSLFRIGDRYIPRYLHIGPDWMTKRRTSGSAEPFLAEELAYLQSNPHEPLARRVFELAHIEYGRMDYGLLDGRLQVWEINLAPVIAGSIDRCPGQNEDEPLRDLMVRNNAVAHAALGEAFKALDPGPLRGGEIPFQLPASLLERARQERRAVTRLALHQARISRVAAWPAFRGVGPFLRQALGRVVRLSTS